MIQAKLVIIVLASNRAKEERALYIKKRDLAALTKVGMRN